MIVNRMVNHYKVLADPKSVIKIQEPRQHIKVLTNQKPKTINYVDWFNSMVKTNGNHLLHISPVPIVSILDRNHKQLKDHYDNYLRPNLANY